MDDYTIRWYRSNPSRQQDPPDSSAQTRRVAQASSGVRQRATGEDLQFEQLSLQLQGKEVEAMKTFPNIDEVRGEGGV